MRARMAKRWKTGRARSAPSPAPAPPNPSGNRRPRTPPAGLPGAFLFEIRAQCTIAHRAFKDIERELTESRAARRAMVEAIEEASQTSPGPATGELKDAIQRETGRSILLLGLIQAMLAAAGVVSTSLWPSKSKAGGVTELELTQRQGRGNALRQLLEVPDDSPLAFRDLREKDARGGMLHFDEMIDQFSANHPGEQVRSLDFGVLEAGADWSPGSALRSLDEETLILRIQGRPPRTCDLRALDAELLRVGGRVQISATVSSVRRPRKSEGDPGASFHMVT
jgi:hypothetical protein